MMVPVHVVGGFLGTGKTTAIRAWMAENAGSERCAVIVNDFGEAGIDAVTLGDGSAARIVNIPGGCVCCTAPEGLAQTLDQLLRDVAPDRIFIEPSGLARPQDVVDMLVRGALRDRVAHMPTVVLVDPRRIGEGSALLDAQLEAADVVVANRCDLASPADMAAFRQRVSRLWPTPVCVVETTFGELPPEALEWPDAAAPERAEHAHDHDHGVSTEGYFARSWIFEPDLRFGWDGLRALLAGTPGIDRFKGVFRGDIGWFRVEVAGGTIHLSTTGYRRDSRADLITRDPALLDRFDEALRRCVVAEAEPPRGPAVVLVGIDGYELTLTREALAALPGQVPDVSALVPGRAGEGILLRELFPLTTSAPNARYVVSASDGLDTAPAPIAGVGSAVLVHSLGGGELPASQGGPLRLLVPPPSEGAAKSNCANVKGVVRIRILPAG
jgi:G3E family GTPase